MSANSQPAKLKVAKSGTKGSSTTKPVRSEALLQAALELFATRRYEDISVDDICVKAGVAHGLLAYHFGGKRGIFAAAVQRAWEDLVSFEKPLSTEATLSDRFRGYLFRHLEYARSNPDRFRMMIRPAHADDQVREILKAARRDYVKEIEAILGCPSEGASPRLRLAIAGWAGFVDTVTLDYIDNQPQVLNTEMISDMCAQVLVASVRSASDIRIDADVELEALGRVAGFDQSRLAVTAGVRSGS